MRIISGNYEVIYSGTVIGVRDKPIEFRFPRTHASLIIIIEFKEDPTIRGSQIIFDQPTDKSLRLNLINTKADLGSGNSELLELGFLNNRKLFLNYRIYSIKELSKTVHYTFYLGEEVDHGA